MIALAASAAFAQTTTTARARYFEPVGLGSTETLQINLLNSASASSSGTAASCTGSVSFLNASGAAIGSAKTYAVAGGQVVSFSLPFSSAGATARTEIVVSITPTSSSAPCALSTTLETFDTGSGATHIHIGGGGEPGPGFGGFGH